jgi:anti-repressor protein
MKNLIKIITKEEGLSVVSSRELHDYLEVKTPLTSWMPRMLEYGFEEGKDFSSFLGERNGSRPSREYSITIDSAKEISMIQRSDKGKQGNILLRAKK